MCIAVVSHRRGVPEEPLYRFLLDGGVCPMTANSSGSAADSLPVLPAVAVDGAMGPLRGPPSEELKQDSEFRKALRRFIANRVMRLPILVGGLLAPAAFYGVQVILGSPSGLTVIPIWAFPMLGALLGSIAVDLSVRFVGACWNGLGIPHYWRRWNLWFTYRLGRISPKQYFELGAVLDYHWHCGQLSPDARPKPQDEFVREAVHWRMESRKKRGGRKRGAHRPRSL